MPSVINIFSIAKLHFSIKVSILYIVPLTTLTGDKIYYDVFIITHKRRPYELDYI